jgi:hypothetical protein
VCVCLTIVCTSLCLAVYVDQECGWYTLHRAACAQLLAHGHGVRAAASTALAMLCRAWLMATPY